MQWGMANIWVRSGTKAEDSHGQVMIQTLHHHHQWNQQQVRQQQELLPATTLELGVESSMRREVSQSLGGSSPESRQRHVDETRRTWNLHRWFETSTQCGAGRRTLERCRRNPKDDPDVAGSHQQPRYEESRDESESFPKDCRFLPNDGKSRRTTWHEQCERPQVQRLWKCLSFQNMTAHFEQNLLCFGCPGMWATPGDHNAHLDAQYATTIPMRTAAEFNSGLMQNCKAMQDSVQQVFWGLLFADETTLAACQSAMAVRENCEQLGRFETLQVEEECESFLFLLHRFSTVAWPLHKDDTHFNRDSFIFTSWHVKSHVNASRPWGPSKRSDCQLFFRN